VPVNFWELYIIYILRFSWCSLFATHLSVYQSRTATTHRQQPPSLLQIHSSHTSACARLGRLSLLAHSTMVAPYLDLLPHIPESYVTNCDSDTILQARIEDFGGAWWLVYSPQTPSSWNSCCISTPSLPSSHHIQHPHLGWWWQSSFWTISSNLGQWEIRILVDHLVFTSNLCLISLRVCQRTIWGLLRKMLWNSSLKSASRLNLIGFVSCFLSIRTIANTTYIAHVYMENFLHPYLMTLIIILGAETGVPVLKWRPCPTLWGHPSSSTAWVTPFFICYDYCPCQDKLTIKQTVQFPEAELGRPTVLMATRKRSETLSLERLDFSNPSHDHGCTDDSVLTGVLKHLKNLGSICWTTSRRLQKP